MRRIALAFALLAEIQHKVGFELAAEGPALNFHEFHAHATKQILSSVLRRISLEY